MAVVQHVVEESSATVTSAGIEVVDVYVVRDLSGPPGARPYLATQQGGIPRWGQGHPTIAGISVDSVSCRPEDTSTFRITVTSRRPVIDSADSGDPDEIDDQDYGTLEFFYQTRDVETQFDADGKQITVSHTFITDPEHGRAGLTFTQAGTVQIQTWQQGVRFSRRESDNPAELQGVYGNKLNATRWNGYDERSVMCIGIDGATTDGGVTWQVNYAFALDPYQGWKKDVLFSDDKRNGDPPTGLITGIGYKSVDVYPVVDFSPLSIDFSRMRRKTSGGRSGRSPVAFSRK